jgi:hypothetical protein
MSTYGKPMSIKGHRERKEKFYKEGTLARQNRGKRKAVDVNREKIAKDMEIFLHNGGQIEELPGPSDDSPRHPAWQWE